MKAELFSSDFLISFFVFLTAFIIIVSYYQNLQNDTSEVNQRNEMYSKAINIASLLATTSGQPRYWNATSVNVIGLYDSGEFNLTKFEYLNSTNYNKAKVMLGTGAYEFLLALKYNNTEITVQNPANGHYYSYGSDLSTKNPDQVVVVKRIGLVNISGGLKKVTLEVILWL
jgi:hypothetical protein